MQNWQICILKTFFPPPLQFFFGSEPTLLDIVAFSFIGMALAVDENDDIAFKKMCEEDFQNLKRHFERVKAKYWPDWDEKVSKLFAKK